MKSPSIFAVVTSALLGLGMSSAAANDRCESGCIEFTPELELTGSMTLDPGGYSQTTGEHLTASTAYFEAHVERPDGSVHPGYGPERRGVLVFKTMSGRYILRVVEIPNRDTN
jgi:hypothetical protein